MCGNVEMLFPADNPDEVLKRAVGEYEMVFMLGWLKDGSFDARASTNMSKKEILWLIKEFEWKLMAGDYDE